MPKRSKPDAAARIAADYEWRVGARGVQLSPRLAERIRRAIKAAEKRGEKRGRMLADQVESDRRECGGYYL